MCLSIDLKAVQLALVYGGRDKPSRINREALDRHLFPQNLYPGLESCLNGEGRDCDVECHRDSVLVEQIS